MDRLVSLLAWLCCVKRGKKVEDEEVDTAVLVDTGQGGYQPTDNKHQPEPPWVRKYFQAAPYHPEYFESDCDDDDDEDAEEESIDNDDGDDPAEEKFNFPFHDSIFRFPHKDYDEIWGTRRQPKRKTRNKKKMENNDRIGKISTWDQI